MSVDRFVRWALLWLCLALAGCYGSAGGGSGSSTPESQGSAPQLALVAALGAITGAQIDVYDTSGHRVMSGATDNNGQAVMVGSQAVNGPVVVKVTLVPGSTYFDEGINDTVTVSANTPLTDRILLSVLPQVGLASQVGATPLSNMAAKLAGVSIGSDGTLVLPASGTLDLNEDKIATAAAKVNLLLGLPGTFNVLGVPTDLATPNVPNPRSEYGKVLAALARGYANDNPGASAPALAQMADLASAVNADGTINTNLVAAKLTPAARAIATPPSSLNLRLATRSPVTDLARVAPAYLTQKANLLKVAIASGAATATPDASGANDDPVASVDVQDGSQLTTSPGLYSTISIAVSNALNSIQSVVC